MELTDVTFLLFFLPVALTIYYLGKDRIKNYILLIISLVFYANGSLNAVVLLLISIGINYALGILLANSKNTPGGGYFGCGNSL